MGEAEVASLARDGAVDIDRRGIRRRLGAGEATRSATGCGTSTALDDGSGRGSAGGRRSHSALAGGGVGGGIGDDLENARRPP